MPDAPLDLHGRTAVVTGAGQGIGLATLSALLDAGMNVVGGDLVVDELRTRTEAHGDAAHHLEVDLATPDGPDRLVAVAADRYGSVDVLVNNAATIGAQTAFGDVTDAQWQRGLDINLLAAVRASRAALPHMTRRRRGVIVHIGSDAGELAPPGFAPYAVSKAALMNLSTLLSKEFGRHGVRSNVIAVGLTRTHATQGLIDDLAERYETEDAGIAAFSEDQGMALPRFGTAQEVAHLVAYLASDLAAQITGTTIRVDGGAVPTV